MAVHGKGAASPQNRADDAMRDQPDGSRWHGVEELARFQQILILPGKPLPLRLDSNGYNHFTLMIERKYGKIKIV